MRAGGSDEKTALQAAPLRFGKVDVNDLLPRILAVGGTGRAFTKNISVSSLPSTRSPQEEDLMSLAGQARDIFMEQPPLIEVEPPLRVCGDTHGQYGDVLRLFDRGGFPPFVNYLFLGDYIDRGNQNLEVISLLFCYKIRYPLTFFLLRGNHECSNVNRVYGFLDECKRRYTNGVRIYHFFQEAFSAMPVTALVGGRILCMHGGLSPHLLSLDQLRCLQRPMMDPPPQSLLLDLLWSDPDPENKGWNPNNRGVSFTFGTDVLQEAVQRLDIDLIARAHQVVQDGYEFFGNRRLITVFSAPHYCGQFDNAAAWMSVDEDLSISLQVLRPTTRIGRVLQAPVHRKTRE